MAILTQSGLESGEFAEGAASFRNYAGQLCYKHPWGAKSDASAILFLPSFERGLFYGDRVAHRNDVMGELAVETLAVAASLRSALACTLLIAWYRLLSFQRRRVVPCFLTRPFPS